MTRRLADELDALARNFPPEYVGGDPLGAVTRFAEPLDIEVAGIVAACLAYGNVKQICASVARALAALSPRPAVAALRVRANLFGDFKHRFTGAAALAGLVAAIGQAQKRHGSLEDLFLLGYEPGAHIRGALDRFAQALRDAAPAWSPEKEIRYLLPSAEAGSACKRLNLFLRWMVRRGRPDFGIWRRARPADLVMPVDVHVLRIAQCLGLTRRRAASWQAAREITERLRAFDAGDPVRFDFAIAHLGMRHSCGRNPCETCPLVRFRVP